MMTKEPHTLEQLPSSAATYYQQSVAEGVFTYAMEGQDAGGRRVYQKYLGEEKYGSPRALLSYSEFVAAVKLAARQSGPRVGIPRWTEPFYS
jgi:hypothetical protein